MWNLATTETIVGNPSDEGAHTRRAQKASAVGAQDVSPVLVAPGFPPNCGGPGDVCREARHLSFLRQEAQETPHEVVGVTSYQPISLGWASLCSFRRSGGPSIRAKALSRQTSSPQCFAAPLGSQRGGGPKL